MKARVRVQFEIAEAQGKKGWRTWERGGSGGCAENREREGAVAGGEGWQAGPAWQWEREEGGVEGAGAGLVWAKQAESEGGNRFVLFFQTNFQTFFQIEFWINFLLQKFTPHKIKVLQHECIKKFSKLILNFNFPKLLLLFLLFLYLMLTKLIIKTNSTI